MPKRLTPQAILALQEALSVIYHFKKDLRRFLTSCGVETTLLAQADWNENKRQIVSDLFELFLKDQIGSQPILTTLCHNVAAMDNFSHLAALEDGERKVVIAKAAVAELRRLVNRHDTEEEKKTLAAERRSRLINHEARRSTFESKLLGIRSIFRSLSDQMGSPQKRGAELEAIMNDLFALFDLDPKESFRDKGRADRWRIHVGRDSTCLRLSGRKAHLIGSHWMSLFLRSVESLITH
jgi:hypothetical protein